MLPMAAVRTDNNISKYFKLQRGTRHGCPLSPHLFAIAIETACNSFKTELHD